MNTKVWQGVMYGLMMSSLAACGGGSSGSSSAAASSSSVSAAGSVALLISDDSAEDWALIGVKVLSIALVPQTGGSNVVVYTAPATPPVVNLAQLDQISELLGTVQVPVGTYTGAVLTIAANKGDVLLTSATSPETGFAGPANTAMDSNDIRIQGSRGSVGNLTTPVAINFQTPLVVTANQSNVLDLEFDLNHPAFIIGHAMPGNLKWAVNFNGPVRHNHIADVTRLVLRHLYGSVTTVASDNSSITLAKQLPALPIQNPVMPMSTSQSVTILADATNGTLFYDMDAKTSSTLQNFSTLAASLVGKQVRVAARYQQNGTLVATRIWASTDFNKIWLSPEGHVQHVDTGNNTITVLNESGAPVTLVVNNNTQFVAGNTLLGTGTAFLANNQIVRGFKVHASVVDPAASPLVAQTIEIQNANYSGKISNATSSGFTYTRNFFNASDSYSYAPGYIAATTSNGKDASGNAITGFKYWNFAYPTLVNSGASAITNFVTTASGSVNFGGVVGSITTWGASRAMWGDGASNTTGWYAPQVVLMPTPIPLGTVANGLASNQFTMNVIGGTQAGTVTVSNTSGSATLVYQVDRTNGVVTVNPLDITNPTGMTTLTNALISGTKVKVDGVPQSDSTLRAYVLTYFTGDQPNQ